MSDIIEDPRTHVAVALAVMPQHLRRLYASKHPADREAAVGEMTDIVLEALQRRFTLDYIEPPAHRSSHVSGAGDR